MDEWQEASFLASVSKRKGTNNVIHANLDDGPVRLIKSHLF